MKDHLSFNTYDTPLVISASDTTTEEELLIIKSASSLIGSGDLCMWVYPDAGELVVARPGRRLPVKPDDCVISAAPDYIDYQLGRAMAAETRLRRYAKANKLTGYVTLGYQKVDGDRYLETATRDPERFLRKLRKYYSTFPYVAVAEFGEQFGKLHWNFLLPEHIGSESLMKAWVYGDVYPKTCPTIDDLETVVRYISKDFADIRKTVLSAISLRSRFPNAQDTD